MYKILVFGMTENPGGVESVIMNYYHYMDKNTFHFDFLCNSYNKIAFEEEIISNGSQTFHFPARSKNYKKYKKELKNFFENNASKYDAIWVNVCSLANIDYLKMAKKYGIKRRIIHSHNSQNMDSRLRGILHKYNKKIRSGDEAGKNWVKQKIIHMMCINFVRNLVEFRKLRRFL